MKKTILLTGATDGIGRETAKMLIAMDHHLLVHGRSRDKLDSLMSELSDSAKETHIESYVADLSRIGDVEKLSDTVADQKIKLDVIINNAGIFTTPNKTTAEGLDVRFMVNSIAPYLLTKKLLPMMDSSARVINLSSAAQAPVDLKALSGHYNLPSDGAAYAQSKLAITMWTNQMASILGKDGPAIIAVNPQSFLGSKMVKEAYGREGGDLRIGAEILCRAALSDEFAQASGRYFDNDIGQFSNPHPDALNSKKCEELVKTIEKILAEITE